MNSDITRIRFSDKARWAEEGGEKKHKERFKVIEEKWLEESRPDISLGSVMAVYRNLRENYEFRLRYDEAGEFFIREMELKRKYREAPTISSAKLTLLRLFKWIKRDKDPIPNVNYVLRQNRWPRRNLSLTGLYYHLSRYGEDLLRPTLIGIAIVFGSTLFWLTQSNQILVELSKSIKNEALILLPRDKSMVRLDRLGVFDYIIMVSAAAPEKAAAAARTQ
jgi:hypothetical protein